MSAPLMPPRLKNWTPGTIQVGLFIRDEHGGRIEMVADDAPPGLVALARRALHWKSEEKEDSDV